MEKFESTPSVSTFASIQSLNRSERALKEFQNIACPSSRLPNSFFAGPGEAQLVKSLGPFNLFCIDKPSAPVFSTVLKLNLLLSVMVVFFFTFQIASNGSSLLDNFFVVGNPGRALPLIILWTLGLAGLAALLWLFQRPKRLKVLPDMLVLRTDLNDSFFGELAIPWQSLEKVEVLHKRFVGLSEIEPRVKITTALGLTHSITVDELLVDNSEASFVNAIRTWAPWAASELTFRRSADVAFNDENDGRLTQLWLHQFSVCNGRKQSDMLYPGAVLQVEGGEAPSISSDNAMGAIRSKQRRYEILGVLGGGGQGNTYLASGLASGFPANLVSGATTALAPENAWSEVVLKEYILPVYRGSSVLERLSARLAEEASLLAQLNHPSIVKVHDHFVCDYRGYLVLEYVAGRSLKDLVAAEGTQPQSVVFQTGQKLLQVLSYMHSFSPPIVHRDLSPDNIMLSDDGQVKVVDFNVARQLEGGAGSTVVGKHAYIPPEQFRGRPCPASDLYALGGTLFFLLTGQEPEPLSVLHPKDFNGQVSTALDIVVSRATELELSKRYSSAGEMLADLSRVEALPLQS